MVLGIVHLHGLPPAVEEKMSWAETLEVIAHQDRVVTRTGTVTPQKFNIVEGEQELNINLMT